MAELKKIPEKEATKISGILFFTGLIGQRICDIDRYESMIWIEISCKIRERQPRNVRIHVLGHTEIIKNGSLFTDINEVYQDTGEKDYDARGNCRMRSMFDTKIRELMQGGPLVIEDVALSMGHTLELTISGGVTILLGQDEGQDPKEEIWRMFECDCEEPVHLVASPAEIRFDEIFSDLYTET